MVYSFDVFDTCLCRLCGEPRNLFDVLSVKIFPTNNDEQRLATEHTRQMFVALREDENRHGGTLLDIYNRLKKRIELPLTAERMVEMEEDTERDMLVSIRATAEIIKDCRRKGDIFFISDMYLSHIFIEEQLRKYGIFEQGDRLYVSEDHKAYKSDGSMFRLIHDNEHLAYKRWHHFGDNKQSDYIVPKQLGIHAHHLCYDYVGYEQDYRKHRTIAYPVSEILAGVCRGIRLSSQADGNQTLFVAHLSAPLMISWVMKVLHNARNRGIRRLYFCSRDAHSEYLIARHLSRSLFPDIEVKYLFVSRQSVYENNEHLIDYLKEAGVISDQRCAIVDIVTSGRTSIEMNTILAQHGYPPLLFYFFFRVGMNTDTHCQHVHKKHECIEIDVAYMMLHSPEWARLTTIRLFFEILFTLNYHKKTIGYRQSGSHIRPIFGNDNIDTWTIPEVKRKKKENDNLLIEYTDALIKTGLIFHFEDILQHDSYPTWQSFIHQPKRIYLEYLYQLVVNGQRFVDKRTPLSRNKAIWRRASNIYSLPRKKADQIWRMFLGK